eukprot:2602308-Ditylum_brightwellii.AAC.1
MLEDGTYISAEDDDYDPEEYEDDLADEISCLSAVDDEYSFAIVTTAVRSSFAENKSHDLRTHEYASGTPVTTFS